MNEPNYRYSIIPGGAVTDRSLEPRDLQVLCLLGRHTNKQGWCFRSQVTMAQELGCGRSSVQRSLDRLYQAGWVEKKLRSTNGTEADPHRPHAAHAYRVVLDRDDIAWEAANDEASRSYAENASQEVACPPVGTPQPSTDEAQNEPGESPESGHPGAQPYVGTGCPAIRGHMKDLREGTSLEPERDARARERQARGLVDFEMRWPTAAADDRQRTAYAWSKLTEAERDEALSSIARFLDHLKRFKRSAVPAGWKYLEEKRWTLLNEIEKAAVPSIQKLAADSDEAKAVVVLYTIAGKASALTASFMRSSDGGLYYRREITPQLLALASFSDQSKWTTLTHQQAGAWNGLLREFVTLEVWTRLVEGSRAPLPWPPRKDGSLSTAPPNDNPLADESSAALQKTG